jgi:hypothetical protein
MKEATEVAKLRLFLKLVASVDADRRKPNLGIEPLPDIDFNIRAGNALVGFATKQALDDALASTMEGILMRDQINELSAKVAQDFAEYKELQLSSSKYELLGRTKAGLKKSLADINTQLNALLHQAQSGTPYDTWLESHKPFHWFAEFYEIIVGQGGFDVIIGNPPYVVYNPVDIGYQVKDMKSYDCMNLYGYCMERSSLLGKNHIGMIVPLSVVAGDKFKACRQEISPQKNVYWSHFDVRPSKLFDGVDQRLTIFITTSGNMHNFSTRYNRWTHDSRHILFNLLQYNHTVHHNELGVAKMSEGEGLAIYNKLSTLSHKVTNITSPSYRSNQLIFRSAGGRYYLIFFSKPQKTLINGISKPISAEKSLYLVENAHANTIVATVSSSLFYWYYVLFSDARNLTKGQIYEFTVPKSVLSDTTLHDLGVAYQTDTNNKSLQKTMTKKNGDIITLWEIYPRKSKHIIDEIDRVLAQHYGFTDEELDYIINYDIKYRMGRAGAEGDDDAGDEE